MCPRSKEVTSRPKHCRSQSRTLRQVLKFALSRLAADLRSHACAPACRISQRLRSSRLEPGGLEICECNFHGQRVRLTLAHEFLKTPVIPLPSDFRHRVVLPHD